MSFFNLVALMQLRVLGVLGFVQLVVSGRIIRGVAHLWFCGF